MILTIRTILLESVALVAIVTIFVSTCVGIATANVPTIVSVENTSYPYRGEFWMWHKDEWLVYVKVQIDHANPTPAHYVDWIEVDFMGDPQQFQMDPQPSNPFSVELYLGTLLEWQLSNEPAAKVRVHCTTHGWSAWSNPVPIPEFPAATIVAFTALAASLFILEGKPTMAQLRKTTGKRTRVALAAAYISRIIRESNAA